MEGTQQREATEILNTVMQRVVAYIDAVSRYLMYVARSVSIQGRDSQY